MSHHARPVTHFDADRARERTVRRALASLRDAVAAYEKDLILDALKSSRGNRAKAARLLDTTERILTYKVRNYAIDARRFRP